MTSEVTQADRLIYVQWSDDGQHIRKWAREPFAGATAFANAGNGAPLGPFDASEHYPIKHLPFALRETAQNIYVECAPHVLEDMVRIITDAANVIEDRTAQSGEGRSGAGEDALREALKPFAAVCDAFDYFIPEAMPDMRYPVAGTDLASAMVDCPTAIGTLTEADFRRARAALNSRQSGEGGREALRREIINTPETADFMAGVPIEAAHQRERWGANHDAGKTPFDWFWLIGYLAQKAATSAVNGNIDKALHHTISTAAALANWHAALSGADTAMRPGIAPPASLDEAALRATDDAGGAK